MSVFSRILPQPLMSLLILGLWLILAPAPGLGQALISLVLAVSLPWATRGFWPDRPRLSHPVVALRLLGVVLSDIVTANLLVARQVLGPAEALRPGFLEVPLDLGDPFLAGRREKDEREPPLLAVEAAHFLEADKVEKGDRCIRVGDADHAVQIFDHAG